MGLKIAVIGGGSSYTPEIFSDLAEETERLDVDQVVLMDPNAEKVAFITKVSEDLVKASGMSIKVTGTDQLDEAVSGADFIILQIRVGGLAARIRDEKLPMEFGMVGNETTGAGGFVCALRSITAILEIARTIQKLSPDAWVLNLTNPAGIVTEALLNHTDLKTLGFCNIPINTTYAMADVLGAHPEKVKLDSFGLNHLSWVQRVLVDDVERLQPLIEDTQDRDSTLYTHGIVDELMEPDFLHTLAMIPSWYVRYFYFPEKTFEEDQRDLQSKGESDIQAEKKLYEIYTKAGYADEARHILASKGGAQYYLPVLQAIHAVVEDSGDVIISDVHNGTALPDLPPDACVEVPAKIFKDHTEPLPVGRMPTSVRGLVQTVKAYEQLTIQAALTGSRNIAIEALMANPLVSSYYKASEYFERVLENERPYIPQFYR